MTDKPSACGQEMPPVTVVDSIMGSGKTTWAREYMLSHRDEKWWFISPYKEQIRDMKRACFMLDFQRPMGDEKENPDADDFVFDENGDVIPEEKPKQQFSSKSKELLSLIRSGANIVCTHALFLLISQDSDTLNLIRKQQYHLIIDEVLDVVKDEDKKARDIRNAIRGGTFSVDDHDRGRITWKDEGYTDGHFLEVRKDLKNGDVYCFREEALIWLFGKDIFTAFREIHILTYLFSGSMMRNYFGFYGIRYRRFHVENGRLTEGPEHSSERKRQIRELISLYPENGKYYKLPGVKEITPYYYSKTWYAAKANAGKRKKLLDNAYNYLHNYLRYEIDRKNSDLKNEERIEYPSVKNTMYTVFLGTEPIRSFKGSFVQCGQKATNMHKDRVNIVYLVNMFVRPEIVKFFAGQDNGVLVDKKGYALSMMLQWIWRSAIRDNKPINLFIASPRMRMLFREWIEEQEG